MSAEWSLPFRFSDQNVLFSSLAMRVTYYTHFIVLDLTFLIMFGAVKCTNYRAPHYAFFRNQENMSAHGTQTYYSKYPSYKGISKSFRTTKMNIC
jgi:hypothetical protein